jgi:hypothetical protein
MEETRRPQDQLGITGLEAMAKTGTQGLPFKSHKIFTSYQDSRTQNVPKAMVKFVYHEQLQEQMNFPKEAKKNSQDPGYSTAPGAMVKFGQTSPPSQALAIILFTQDSRTQDALEDMVKFSSREQLQEQMTFPKDAKGSSQYSGHSTALEAMVQFGQMSPPSKSLAIGLFTQDTRTQDAP